VSDFTSLIIICEHNCKHMKHASYLTQSIAYVMLGVPLLANCG